MLLFWGVYREQSCTGMKLVYGWQFHPPERSSSWWKVLCPSEWACAKVWVWQGGLRLNLDSDPRLPLQTVSDWCCTDSESPLSFVWDHRCLGGHTGQTETNLMLKIVLKSYEYWHLNLFLTYICYLLLSDGWKDCLQRLLRELRWGKRLRYKRVCDTGHPLQWILKIVSKTRK